MVVMAAAASAITAKSPYIVRTSFTLPQVATAIAQWSARNGIRTVFTMVTDYSPGADAETAFQKTFTALGGTIVGAVRVPLKNPDYAPFLQRAKDARPDAVFVFVPSGEGAPFMKQFADRGLAEAGIRLIGTGDTTDDDILDSMGDAALGAITAHHYSAAHPSPENKAYVASFMKANGGMRPNFMSVAGYDGMHLIVAGLEKTGGSAAGDAFIDAVKGMSWTSPRGPVKIEPDTRDITQNVYIRRVEAVDGKLFNVEFDEIDAVKDPGK
jgi:branched-chain amino acid transport system substrate-binding protein